ncbi:hypothetical protein [Chryseobacterium nepalense]|uniref:ATP-binding protein n=1 Tax=Chryseobacterium nepalense TaxID=1854498 RepID=A0ABY4K7E1_9FLAO|nr:hypothetical protein [Chryseobacterium nepalense]UPQ75280.1 hypothetical protein M0D58_14665 [Chryseobacterium nepalense]
MNIPILKKNITFTPYVFYTDFLKDIAIAYKAIPNGKIQFTLTDGGDNSFFESTYRIDPITIPLLLSISEQLKKFHNEPIDLILYNTRGTIDVLEFLYLSDFFYLSGNNRSFQFPLGQDIYNFNQQLFGSFKGKVIKAQHKIRGYSINDNNVSGIKEEYKEDEELLRDALVEHYTYLVKEHFLALLYENEFTSNQHNLFINILSELITNGVIHSKSSVFALMFVDRFKTKFSISDNGIGFTESLKFKKGNNYYEPYELTKLLNNKNYFKNIHENIINNLISIFEALFYSFMKNRRGIFDLMINVVLNSRGYFRLHSENSQIIISNRMKEQLLPLNSLRETIFEYHNMYELSIINNTEYNRMIIPLKEKALKLFTNFFTSVQNKFNTDVKFSSIRFYPVKFRGVHIEVEIPNNH